MRKRGENSESSAASAALCDRRRIALGLICNRARYNEAATSPTHPRVFDSRDFPAPLPPPILFALFPCYAACVYDLRLRCYARVTRRAVVTGGSGGHERTVSDEDDKSQYTRINTSRSVCVGAFLLSLPLNAHLCGLPAAFLQCVFFLLLFR